MPYFCSSLSGSGRETQSHNNKERAYAYTGAHVGQDGVQTIAGRRRDNTIVGARSPYRPRPDHSDPERGGLNVGWNFAVFLPAGKHFIRARRKYLAVRLN